MEIKSKDSILKQLKIIKIIKEQLRDNIHIFLAQYPELYIPYTHWRDSFSIRGNYGGRLLSHDTDIIIDGFPRSANSFAVSALTLAQHNKIKIAHHRHDPAQIIAAVKKNLPVLVLIRHPKDATVSLIIRNYSFDYTYASIKGVLKQYLQYYQKIIPYKDKIILANFETVTNNFNLVISQINKRFKTDYQNFIHNQENVDRCFYRIEEKTIKSHEQKKIIDIETAISRPSKVRNDLKEKLLNDFDLSENKKIYEQSYAIYESLKSCAI